MSPSVFRSILETIATRRVVLLYAAAWTVLLTVTVAVASFSPEIAFVTAISPSSSLSKSCNGNGSGNGEGKGFVRIPLSDPTEVLCFPAQMVRSSKLDFFVPTVFVALIVAASACVVRWFGLSGEPDRGW